MYDVLGNHNNKAIDKLKIKDWCLENLSASEFWFYLNLNDADRNIFEETFWKGYIEKATQKDIKTELEL